MAQGTLGLGSGDGCPLLEEESLFAQVGSGESEQRTEAGALGWWERRCPGIPSRDKCSGGKVWPRAPLGSCRGNRHRPCVVSR